MAYSIIVAGGTVYKVTPAGVATALTLPTGVTIDATRQARMTVLGRNVVIVNAPSRSIWVDPSGVIRPLILQPPSGPPKLAAGGGGGLTGSYNSKYTHIVKDPNTKALLMESDYSPVSATQAVAAQLLAASGVNPSPDTNTVTGRRMYRPTTGPGSVYYNWFDLDGNTITAGADDTSDALLPLLAAPTELGSAPGMLNGTRMTQIVAWKNRLWGVGDQAIDTIRYSGSGLIYAWPLTYGFDVAPVGGDEYGITGLMSRRDELGIAKRHVFWKVSGGTSSDFQLTKVAEGPGCYSGDTVVIIQDIAYFLGEDGVYTWGPDGVKSVSNGKVRAWFATDTYFNRSMFSSAFAKYNPKYHTYELHLASVGNSTIDRWVSLDLATGNWYGPHRTSALTATCPGIIVDTNGQLVPVMGGSNGYVYTQNNSGFTDDGSAISFNLLSKFHDGNTPDILKNWGMLSLILKAQTLAGTSRIDARVGSLDTGITNTLAVDPRRGAQKLQRLGVGRFAQLEFTDETNAQGCEIYGYEMPFFEIGGR